MASFSVSQESKQQQKNEKYGDLQKGSDQEFSEVDWVQRLAEHLEATEDEAERAIENKIDEYDGLVSMKSSAAILVAKDHGIDLRKGLETAPDLEIENIVPGMSNVDLHVRVNKVNSENSFDGGRVRNIVIGDSTGETQLTAWNEDCDAFNHVQEGDTVKLFSGYTKKEVSDWQKKNYDGIPSVHIGDDAQLIVTKEEGDEELIEPE